MIKMGNINWLQSLATVDNQSRIQSDRYINLWSHNIFQLIVVESSSVITMSKYSPHAPKAWSWIFNTLLSLYGRLFDVT